MKKSILLLLLFFPMLLWSQKDVGATNEFMVTGLVKNETKITLKEIKALPSKDLPEINVANHKGDAKGILKQAKGILVKDLLKNVDIKEDNSKLLSEYYFCFVANDNYKAVYSWNEIFNSPTGDNIYIITSIGEENLDDMRSRILVVTPTDYRTGRRFIKALSKIVVSKAE